jgi:hypothetical protein
MKSVDCACVIHGDYYDWVYVERLYNMLQANCSYEVRLHVFTEAERSVPDHMVKHALTPWPGISGPKQAWWYKMQLFDSRHFSGQLLYLDLDTVIVGNIDWLWALNSNCFHAIHDFKHLWKPTWTGINSSLMLWDTEQYHWIWETFSSNDLAATVKAFRGDQDFLSRVLLQHQSYCYFDRNRVKSWRWQAHNGGLDMKTRLYRKLNSGTMIDKDTSFLIFHGRPKPQDIADPTVQQHWQIRRIA